MNYLTSQAAASKERVKRSAARCFEVPFKTGCETHSLYSLPPDSSKLGLRPEATFVSLDLQIFKDICDQGVVRVMMDWKISRLISVQFRVKEE